MTLTPMQPLEIALKDGAALYGEMEALLVAGRCALARHELAGMEAANAHRGALVQANSTYDAAQRATMAQEVQQLVDNLVSLGNSQVEAQYIFVGYLTDAPSSTPSGAIPETPGCETWRWPRGCRWPRN
jgi:hypothetical protein